MLTISSACFDYLRLTVRKFDMVKAKFEAHFVKNSFITALYGLAKYCWYGNLLDEMIQDRIVGWIRELHLQRNYSWILSCLQSVADVESHSLMIASCALAGMQCHFLSCFRLEGEYTIKLQNGAKPFALTVPC